MKRLLCSTTAISMALWPLPNVPAYAQQMQGDGSVVAIDGTLLCAPTAEAACNPDDYVGQAQAIEAEIAAEQERQAAEAAAEQERQAAEAAAAAEQERQAAEAAAEQERQAAEAAAEQERQAAEAAAAEQERQAAEAAAAEQERQAAEAAAEQERQAAEAAAEQERQAAEAAAEQERQAAEAAAAAEQERQAAEAAAEQERQAAEAAAEQERQAAEAAAAAEQERLAAEAAAAAEQERLAAEAAAEQQRLADEAAALEAQRIADEAAAEAARLAADAAQSEEAQAAADEAAAEAERLATEAADAEATRLANEAAAAAEAQRLTEEAAAAAAEAQRMADEATAAEQQRLADEEAAAADEAQRLADEAAAAEVQRLADEAAAAETQPVTDEAATEPTDPVVLETVIPEVLEVEVAEDGTEVVVTPDAPLVPTVLVDATATPDLAPETVETLGDLLAAPTGGADAETQPEITAAPVADAANIPFASDGEPEPDANLEDPLVSEQILTEADTRSSEDEFVDAEEPEQGGRRDGLSDLEKVGLVALGAILVGAVLNNGNQVVDNTGDRVVVRGTDGQYYVYKDDDALLRRPGSSVRTETYGDGSTRTIVDRGDGTQVVTIRDATGRVLRRATYDGLGREIVLIDDLVEEVRVDVTALPRPTRARVTISTSDGDAELKAALARLQAEELGRSFSLRQIREIPEVRALAATVEVNAITFDSGSAAITSSEAAKLADLGSLVNDLIALNPGEIFLIEGHTDAVGSASSNLTLSDRRAESVARALTEYFAVPPENLVVQGYGESELLIPTTGNERANRRVAVKVITPLMRTAALP